MPVLGGGTDIRYTNTAYPTTGITELHTINYYDDYAFDLGGLAAPPVSVYSQTLLTGAQLKGLPTGSKVRVLDPSTGSGQAWTTTLTGYDPHKRPVWTASKNTYLSTTDFVEIKLNYIGWAEETKNIHQKTGQADLVVIEKFTYDHAGKVLVQTHQTNSNPAQRIADNTYDQLGQLKKKNVGGTTLQAALQNVDYAYNIRGWLKAINDVNNIGTVDLFAFKLGYNEGTSPLYNGNISLTQWKTRNTVSSLKTYNYTYDALNRIKTAINTNANYNLDLVNYDKNGNITALKRKGHTNATATTFGMMDDLVYNYDAGNKLTKVEDIASLEGFKNGANIAIEYTYDQNGNMLTDANKGITGIIYNHLNLPTTVTFVGTNKKIDYFYDAVGTKLKKVVTDASSLITTEYAGNFVYENSVLQFFNTAEGYVEPKGTGWEYVYQYKDHLGNVRLSYADADGNGIIAQTEIREENNFYPFGLKHKGYNNAQNGRDHKYGYNGKEEQDEFNNTLQWLDFGARNYDATLGRWMNVDPFAELYNDISPFNYVKNNPVYFVDPDGNKIDLSDIFSSEEKFEKGMQILLDLSEQTGLSLSVNSDGLLSYAPDKDGNALVDKDEDGNEKGSSLARTALTRAIDHKDTAKFTLVDDGSGSHGKDLNFKIDISQVDSFIRGASAELNDKTMGFGMTFLHELLHTDVSIGVLHDDEVDIFGRTGKVVNIMNSIRRQLGPDYGQRLSYKALLDGGKTHLPFDKENKTKMVERLRSLILTRGSTLTLPGFENPREGKFISY